MSQANISISEAQGNMQKRFILRKNCVIAENSKSCNISLTKDSLPSDDENLQRWTPKPTKVKSVKSESMDMWYDRMGGSSVNSIGKLVKNGAFGIKLSNDSLSVSKRMVQVKANMRAKPHKGQIPRVMIPGYKFWGDAQGPNVRSFIYHYVYVFGWLCDATNWGFVTFAKSRSEAHQSFRMLKAKSPHTMKMVITDGAKEYFSLDLQSEVVKDGATWVESPAYLAKRNPRIEHWWYRTDLLTRYMLSRCGGWRIFWAFAKALAVLIVNVKVYGPTNAIPYESFWKQKFDYTKLCVFGCTVVIRYMTNQGRGTHVKYLDKTQWGFYLGFDVDKWMHICYGIEEGRIYEGADFEPFEQNFGAIHQFMRSNSQLNVLPSEELKSIQPQGEKASVEASSHVSPFGLTKECEKMWDDTQQQMDIDVSLPGIVGDTRIEDGMTNQGEPNDMADNDVGTTQQGESSNRGGPETSNLDDSQIPSANRGGFGGVLGENGNDDFTRGATQGPNLMNEANDDFTRGAPTTPIPVAVAPKPVVIAPSPDASLENQRVANESKTVATRGAIKSGKRAMFNPAVVPSDANAQVKDLASSNEKMLTNSALFTIMTLSAVYDAEEARQHLWHKSCEYAMHAFMIEGLNNGGYFEEVLVHDKKMRKRKHVGTFMPTEFAMPTMDGPEPQTLEEVYNMPDSIKYIEAKDREMQGHYDNRTWEWCELPADKRAISTRLVFVRKVNPDNSLRYKARLVARGFTQVAGENFNWDTIFAPVLKMTSLRWLFSLIAQYNLEVTSSDVVQAFLQADLKDPKDKLDEIYVELPKGCEKTCPTTGKVLRHGRLLKALYGLKQAPRRWAETLTKVMKKIGFKQHDEDPCLYILKRGKSVAIYGIYVDDMIKVTNHPALRREIDSVLSRELKIEHQGPVKEFLGLQLGWKVDSMGQMYFNVSQEKYCRKIITRFGMDQCAPKEAPCNTSGKPSDIFMWPNPDPSEQCCRERLGRYRSGIGALIYLSTMTRPDISYAVNACSQFMSNPTHQHEVALWRIFRYLRTRENYSLKYYKSSRVSLEAYVDANFMGDHDMRSVTGQIFLSGNGIISWSAKRQTTITTSTPHAECSAFFSAVKELIFVRNVIKGFGLQQDATSSATCVWCDNQACESLVSRPDRTNNTKHWNMEWCWLHEQREVYKTYKAEHVESALNWSDIFTKPLPVDKHTPIVAALKLGDV